MLFDALTLFSDGQAVTASAASTDYIDLGATGTPALNSTALARDIGKGNKVKLRIQCTETFLTCTSVKVAVQSDDNSSFSSAATVLETEAIPVASLVAGYVFNIDEFPRRTNERYIRLYYTVAGSSATAGKITAGVVLAASDNVTATALA